MSKAPFYKEHWINIEAERLERYQAMFGWNPASKPLHDPADIREGQVVADFGCAPGQGQLMAHCVSALNVDWRCTPKADSLAFVAATRNVTRSRSARRDDKLSGV